MCWSSSSSCPSGVGGPARTGDPRPKQLPGLPLLLLLALRAAANGSPREFVPESQQPRRPEWPTAPPSVAAAPAPPVRVWERRSHPSKAHSGKKAKVA